MIENKCNHYWIPQPTTTHTDYVCKNCHTLMTAPEIFQLEALENQNETLKHLKGFQTRIAIITVVIASFAMLISLVALLNPILKIIK